jgi:hypothetical protein
MNHAAERANYGDFRAIFALATGTRLAFHRGVEPAACREPRDERLGGKVP